MARTVSYVSAAILALILVGTAQHCLGQVPEGDNVPQPGGVNPPPVTACDKPDQTLLKSRGAYTGRAELPDAEKIEMYNAQARRFNECTRKLVDSNNAEIDRVRDEANAKIKRIADNANSQIAAIYEKIQGAIRGVAPDSRIIPEVTGSPFPDPQCRKPDDALLSPLSKRSNKSLESDLTRSKQFDRQKQDYESCVRDYIERASAENNQIDFRKFRNPAACGHCQ